MAVVVPNLQQEPVEGSQHVTVLAVIQRFPQKFSFTPTQNSLRSHTEKTTFAFSTKKPI